MRTHCVLLVLILAVACRPEPVVDASGEGGGAVTLWSDSVELFMEYPALVVGHPARMAIHLTDMTDFAPIASGLVTLRFVPRDGGATLVVSQETPRLPGIFGVTAEFARAGVYDLTMVVESPQARDSLVVAGLRVVASEADVSEGEGDDGGIPFLKEQQWKTPGFATAFAMAGNVAETFDAPGEIAPTAGRAADVTAPISGLVEVGGTDASPVLGDRVRRGQVLIVLTPTLGEAGSAFAQARRELLEAEEEHHRVTRLAAVDAVSTRRVGEAEIRLRAARESLGGLTGGEAMDSTGKLSLRAPIDGVVVSRAVTIGGRVAPGTRLFRIVDPSVVGLQVHVPAVQAARVTPQSRATFVVAGNDRRYEAGRPVSIAIVVDSLTRTVPVLYEAANPDGSLRVGATATVSLQTGTRVEGVVVPSAAILDEDGRSICYVQLSGERFEKREITVGADDGVRAVVVAGLRAGDRVVTGAAYQVRLASLSTSVPAEGHAH